MPSTRRVFLAGLPLLPLFVRSVPAPWPHALSGFRRDAHAPSLFTGAPPHMLVAAHMSSATAPTTPADASATVAFLAVHALPASAFPADPSTRARRSERILFFPPDPLLAPILPSLPAPVTTASMPPAAAARPSGAVVAAAPPTSAPAANGDLNLDADASGSPSRPLVMAYYPDWAADAFPPEKIDFGRFDWVDFAFAVPGADFNLTWDGSDDAPDLLRRLVSRAHAMGKKVKLSVGGWTGSRYFSAAAASPQTRAALAGNILAMYTQFGLDGIDLDWEYPAQDGAGGNLVSPDDGANFLAFLHVLRATLPPGAVITAATQTVPFAGADGAPMQNVSAFAEVLDWVLLMNYDTWGSSDAPGPNAPLGDACSNSTQGSASALAALRTWTAAGFPASQLVLGVPSYGYISRTSAALLRTRGMPARPTPPKSSRFQKRKHNGVLKTRRHRVLDFVGALVDKTNILSAGTTLVHNEDGGTDNGQVQFRDLVAQGALQPYLSNSTSSNTLSTRHSKKTDENAEGRRLFAGGGGFERRWDACSSTPFLRSAGARQVITYDDPVSLEMKAQLAREAGMRGVNLFDVSGDTDNWDLADALLRGLGVK